MPLDAVSNITSPLMEVSIMSKGIWAFALIVLLLCQTAQAAGMDKCGTHGHITTECVDLTNVDSTIPAQFNNILAVAIYTNASKNRGSKLILWMNGTQGKIDRAPSGPITAIGKKGFLKFAAEAGYRIISVPYDNKSAILGLCIHNSDIFCSENVRNDRLFNGPTSIVYKASRLIQYLAKSHPDMGWDEYLKGQDLNWSRIMVGGQSQGAGMAAFIAKKYRVERVICFSAPLDHSGPRLAPWLEWPSQTPMDRWYATYHVQEPFAPWLKRAYPVLKIPAVHIFAFTSPTAHPERKMSYHGSGVSDPVHMNEWKIMLGMNAAGNLPQNHSITDDDDDDTDE